MRDWAVRQEENSKKYRCSSYKEEPHPKGGPPTPRAETQTLLEREPLWLPGWQRSCRAGNPSPSPSRVPREAVQRAGTLWRHTAMKPPNGGTTRSFWLLGAAGCSWPLCTTGAGPRILGLEKPCTPRNLQSAGHPKEEKKLLPPTVSL